MVLFQDLGADDVAGHQVRGELDAPELQRQRLAQRAHQQGLAEPGHAFEQAVAAGQQPDQQLLDHVVLADDGLADRFAQLAQRLHLALDVGFGEALRQSCAVAQLVSA